MAPKKETAEAPKKAAKKEVDNKKYVNTKQLADRLKTKPASLRRYLRSLPAFTDNSYTRYKWDPENAKDAKFLEDIADRFAKFQSEEKEKNKQRLEKLKAKDKGAKAGKKGSAKKAADDDEEEEEEEEVID
jgi:hypothetical protein